MNTRVSIFHAQNLLHIPKKEKAKIKFMNFSKKYKGSVFWGAHPVLMVWLFNGISTFVGYLMPKPPPEKNSSDAI